jgi:phosphoribosylanthranilate isomerase
MHLRIKICGITSALDACQAARLGADAVGLNFYRHSPRCVDPTAASQILQTLPVFVDAVGVYVNEPIDQIVTHAGRLGRIATLQWHGDDPPLPLPGQFRFIPAFPIRDIRSLEQVARYLHRCRQADCLPAAVLLDAHVPGEYGGTGQTAPWGLLAGFHPEVPLILAGGLTPENVGEAVRLVRPYAVDVASGVESAPGRKDTETIRRFIDNARAAAAGL